jgi:hypothetical protein
MNRFSFKVNVLFAIILSTVVSVGVLGQSSAISFADVTAESGLTVPHISTAENRYIVESMSGGIAVFDCDGDDFLDVATVNGSSVDSFRKGGDPFLTLYRQIDGATSKTPKFENVTAAASLTRKGWGMGVTAVDYDGDSILDLFATGFSGNALYRGKGQCRFEDATESSGLKGSGFQTGAAWADFDRDGDLDVFVPGYVSIDLNNLPVFGSSKTCSYKNIRVQCGPRGLPGERDWFYRNKGDGTFEEIAEKIGLADKAAYFGLGVTFADYNNDGWPDLYVANDSSPNYLYKNNQNGTFSDVSFETGTSYSGTGDEQGSMGVTVGDYDNDGNLDIFVTNFESEQNTLYRNLVNRGFLDVSTQTGVAQPARPFVGWGTSFVDFDNDGLLDILVVNGHVYPQMELVKTEAAPGFRQPMLLHQNLGNGKFADVSVTSGVRSFPLFSSRGAAFGDLNNDGLVDVIVANLGDRPIVLLNSSKNGNQRLIVRLIEARKNRDAIGARVTLSTDKRRLIQEVQAGSSYISQNDIRLHFGFGAAEKIVSVEIRWSDGKIERIAGVDTNRIVTIEQGKGVVKSAGFR